MSAAKTTNILLIGGTGAIGKFITTAILDAKADFGRVALFTSAATTQKKPDLLDPWKARGLEVIVGDITKDEDIAAAYKDFDTVVSAVGRNVIASQTNLIRLAEASNTITRFFPSEYGTDIEYFPHSATEKPHQQKLKVRAFIKDNVKRLQYTYVVTGPYPEMYMGPTKAAPDAGSFDAVNKKAILLGDGNGEVSFTTMPDTGKLVVAALKNPEASKNRALKVNSFTTTPNKVLAEYEKQTGAKWSVTYQSLENLKKAEEQAWAENKPAATAYTLRRIWTEGGTLYKVRDNEEIGAPQTGTLEETVSQLISEAGGQA